MCGHKRSPVKYDTSNALRSTPRCSIGRNRGDRPNGTWGSGRRLAIGIGQQGGACAIQRVQCSVRSTADAARAASAPCAACTAQHAQRSMSSAPTLPMTKPLKKKVTAVPIRICVCRCQGRTEHNHSKMCKGACHRCELITALKNRAAPCRTTMNNVCWAEACGSDALTGSGPQSTSTAKT